MPHHHTVERLVGREVWLRRRDLQRIATERMRWTLWMLDGSHGCNALAREEAIEGKDERRFCCRGMREKPQERRKQLRKLLGPKSKKPHW